MVEEKQEGAYFASPPPPPPGKIGLMYFFIFSSHVSIFFCLSNFVDMQKGMPQATRQKNGVQTQKILQESTKEMPQLGMETSWTLLLEMLNSFYKMVSLRSYSVYLRTLLRITLKLLMLNALLKVLRISNTPHFN